MEECIVTNVNTFNGLNLEDNLEIMMKIQQTVISKYMYRYENKDPFYIKALVSREDDFSVVFPEKSGDKVTSVCKGGSILFNEKLKFEVLKGKFFEYTFLVDPKQKFGEGSKAYKVLYKIQESFEIDVMADSEEEAIETANKQEMYYWNHHQPSRNEKVRPITSFVVWDNVKVTEINE
jgi:hypothetical protein